MQNFVSCEINDDDKKNFIFPSTQSCVLYHVHKWRMCHWM